MAICTHRTSDAQRISVVTRQKPTAPTADWETWVRMRDVSRFTTCPFVLFVHVQECYLNKQRKLWQETECYKKANTPNLICKFNVLSPKTANNFLNHTD